MPIDMTFIQTNVRLASPIANCEPENINKLPSPLRELIRHIKPDATSGSWRPDSPPRIPTRKIHLEGYTSIIVHAQKDPDWRIRSIQLNPSSLHYGHNGRVLSAEDFHRALSIYVDVAQHLLEDPNDAIHLAPGVPQSIASWQSIEIFTHALDEDGNLFKAFANAKHRAVNKEPAFFRNKETITFENSTKELKINIYRKDIQMLKSLKGNVDAPLPVLRIEVKLKGKKLREYLNRATWLDDLENRRLIAFGPSSVRQAFLSVMSGFQGCYNRIPIEAENDCKIGRLIGYISQITDLSVDDLCDYTIRRFFAKTKPASVSNTLSHYKTAARAEIALMSPIKLSHLFSEEAWQNPPYITCSNIERMTLARNQFVDADPRIVASYSDLPAPAQGQAVTSSADTAS